jgi:hypothetical protein
VFRLDVSLVGRKVRETHAEAKASDERKGATTPYRDHRDVKGPVFGSDLCGHDRKVSNKHRKKNKRADWDETFKNRTRATSSHIS